MEDPNGAAAHILKALKPEGTMMMVEPFAYDKFEDNLNPLGRLFYAASLCDPDNVTKPNITFKAKSMSLGVRLC